MKQGVISIGEALIDFIPTDSDNITYQKSPGGAPANVAVGVARLGAKATFLGKVGEDVLGEFLKETLTEYGVETSSMYLSNEYRTGVVFVTLGEGGERSFDFYIKPSADLFLTVEEVSPTLFTEHKVVHFGSISLLSEPARSATKKAVSLAKEHGLVVSYDPNLRLGLWENKETAKATIISMLKEADVLKISEEELAFLTDEEDLEKGIAAFTSQYDIPLIYVTLGSEGSIVLCDGKKEKVTAIKVDAVDTTGAGDAFVSGILYQVQQANKKVTEISIDEAVSFARFASVSGALAASTKGAMTSLPTLEKIEQMLNELDE